MKSGVDIFNLSIRLVIMILVLFSVISNPTQNGVIKSPIKENNQISSGANLQTFEGTSEVIVTDDFENMKGDTYYYLITKDNQQIRLYPKSEQNFNLISGDKIRIKGIRTGNDLTFDNTKSILDNSINGGYDIIKNEIFRSPPYRIIDDDPSGGK